MKFEEAYKELEKIVQNLENNNVELEESEKLFERALFLINTCNNQLSGAKGKIMIYKEQLEELKAKIEE